MATGTIILPIPGLFDDTVPPGLDFANNLPRVLFDDTTDETMYWTFRTPENFASGLTAKILYSMAGANTSKKIEFEVSVWAVADGEDGESENYDTANIGTPPTVPATANLQDTYSIALTNDDSIAAGEKCVVRMTRDAATTDDAASDVQLEALSLEYTTT